MKLTNGKETMLDDLQEGIKRAYPTLKHVAGTRGFINRNFKDEIVPLISGGGSGHDPAHWGFVGDGMLTNYRPKGKPISASTRNTYYLIFSGSVYF